MSNSKVHAYPTTLLGFNLCWPQIYPEVPCMRPKFPISYYGDVCKPDYYGKQMFISNRAPQYLRVTSIDGTKFQLDEPCCRESIVWKEWILWEPNTTTSANLSSYILEKVVYFLENYVELKNSDDHQKMTDFLYGFFKHNHTLLVDLMEAARYLLIRSLFDLTSAAVVDMITGKTDDQILKIMNLKSGFTFKEMAKMHKTEGWGYSLEEQKISDSYVSSCSTKADKQKMSDDKIYFSSCSTEVDKIIWVKTAFYVQHDRKCLEGLKHKENPESSILWRKNHWKKFTRIQKISCILRMRSQSSTKSDEDEDFSNLFLSDE